MTDTTATEQSAQAPTTVYHYTDAQAFAAIVKSAQLRATDFRYLNDSQELAYTWNGLLRKLEESARKPDAVSQAHKAALEAFDRAEALHLVSAEYGIYITCFSEDKKSVNQWSLYANKGSGIALGFDVEKMRAIHVPYNRQMPTGELEPMLATNTGQPVTWLSFLQKVEYGDAAREAVIARLTTMIEQIYTHDFDGATLDEPTKVANLISQITALVPHLPLVKDRSYEYEREWRLTIPEHFGHAPPQIRALSQLGATYLAPYGQTGFGTVDVEFREGGAALFKPYTSLSFDKSALTEVVLGPNLQLPSIKSTVSRLLNRYGFPHTAISRSDSSYRG